MKKIIVRLFLVLVLLVLLAVVAVHFMLDSAIKKAVETVGPELTKVSIKLDGVNLSLLSGSGTVKGLVVGNPEGYKTPSAISVGEATLALEPKSLLSDKVIVSTVNVRAPEVTFETDLQHNNLSKILSNLEEATGGGKETTSGKKEPGQPTPSQPGKKLEVDDFLISGGKIHVSVSAFGGKSATVPLPEIHLKDLGKDADGITPAALASIVLKEIVASATKAAAGAVTDLSNGAVYFGGDAKKGATNAVDKVTKGIGDLFNKK